MILHWTNYLEKPQDTKMTKEYAGRRKKARTVLSTPLSRKNEKRQNILTKKGGIGVILLLEMYSLSFNFALSTFSKKKQNQKGQQAFSSD